VISVVIMMMDVDVHELRQGFCNIAAGGLLLPILCEWARRVTWHSTDISHAFRFADPPLANVTTTSRQLGQVLYNATYFIQASGPSAGRSRRDVLT